MNLNNIKLKELPFFTMLLLISFASVNAVLFTPALPEIRDYFSISENLAQQTITWFLVGYAIGQLVYGPIANRYGRKVALYYGIASQFTNKTLVLGSILMGGSSCFIYVFASISPFIAMQIFGMSSFSYGLSNLLPSIGLVLGSLASANLIKRYSLMLMIKIGMGIISFGSVILYILIYMNLPPVVSIFVPMIVIYFGLCFIFSNVSVISLSKTIDKAHGAAVMSFINIGFATSVVLITEAFVVSKLLLSQVYLLISIVMIVILMSLNKKKA